MNILMLGHSRSGKTSYMAGLYHLFGDEREGVGITTTVTSHSQRLKQLGNNIMHGIYPQGTDIHQEYNFWLTLGGQYIMPFNWIDYRGGALMQHSNTSPDVKTLIDKIKKADALIVFLDGEKLVNDLDDYVDEFDRLMMCIDSAIGKTIRATYFPISFVITKGDMYENYSTLYDSEGFQYFMPLIENIQKSTNVAGMITVCEISKNGIENVFMPLLFSLYYGMTLYINSRIEANNKIIAHYNSLYPTILEDIANELLEIFGLGWNTERAKALRVLKQINEEQERLEMLKSIQSQMKEVLDEANKNGAIINF